MGYGNLDCVASVIYLHDCNEDRLHLFREEYLRIPLEYFSLLEIYCIVILQQQQNSIGKNSTIQLAFGHQ